jgi:conjugal transfer pilus assembly protein TraA
MKKLYTTLIGELLLLQMALSPQKMAFVGVSHADMADKIQISPSSRELLRNLGIFIVLFALMALFSEAFAGTDGDDFADIYTKLEGWSKGTLGKVIALGMFLVGLATGVVQQNIMAVVIGISGALALYYGPGIISSVVSATI